MATLCRGSPPGASGMSLETMLLIRSSLPLSLLQDWKHFCTTCEAHSWVERWRMLGAKAAQIWSRRSNVGVCAKAK